MNTHIRDNLLAVVPVGVVLPFAGSSAPTSLYLLCDGSAVSRTTYSVLFGILSTTYGSGDGSTTFNVPDMRGRVPVGVSAGGASEVANMAGNEGLAANVRNISHYHDVYVGFGESIGGSYGNFPSFDDNGGAYAHHAGADTNNLDAPAYLVLSYIIKALES